MEKLCESAGLPITFLQRTGVTHFFKGGGVADPPKPIPPPLPADAQSPSSRNPSYRRNRGLASTILTSALGVGNSNSGMQTKTLLGQ